MVHQTGDFTRYGWRIVGRRSRYLNEHDVADPLRVPLQESFEGLELRSMTGHC
jgi:hypothetical protein